MRRTPSQNIAFAGPSVGDDPGEPPGRGIAVGFRDRLRREGFAVNEEDNWRDCGWSIDVVFPAFEIEVALSQTADHNRWMAQIAPLKEPGVVARLFGAKFVSREQEVLRISRNIHHWLVESGFQSVLWRIDGFPEPRNGNSEPVTSGEAAAS